MGIRLHPRLKKWIFWTGMTAVLLISLQITALAFPQPWFSHKAQYGHLTFYSDELIDSELEATMLDVVDRLRSVELYDSAEQLRVFVISNPGFYRAFARLSFVPPVVPGFNLSLLDNSYVSVRGTEERRRWADGKTPYSAREGNLAQCIAHEVMHDLMVEDVGFFRTLQLPTWKKEGYAEYGSSLALIQSDTAVPLADRIHTMQTHPLGNRAREYYAWGLVVEFLCDQRGYSHADVMADSVAWEASNTQMLEWYETYQP